MHSMHFRLIRCLLLGCLLSTGYTAVADSELGDEETLALLARLTSQNRKAWISSGTIEATHSRYEAPTVTDPLEITRRIKEEIAAYLTSDDKPELTENLRKMRLDAIPFNVRYRLSNERLTESDIVVRCDEKKYYLEINVRSHRDSVVRGPELWGNFKTNHFDSKWNARRIFAYDGQNHIRYFLPGNNATVDATGVSLFGTCGTLTAGLIPWGNGFYTYDQLVACDPRAVETSVDGRTEIHLTLELPNGMRMVIALDPQKDHAVLSYTSASPDGSQTVQRCSGHRLVAGRWVPTDIVIDRFDAVSRRLLARNHWHFSSVSSEVPEADQFKVPLEDDAMVEYRSPRINKPLTYRHSVRVDAEALLSEKQAFEASRAAGAQNCATAALRYAASRLGKAIPDATLTLLAGEADGRTSLYALRDFARGMGLYAYALKMDIDTLESLSGCEIILHLPGQNHFVVLDHVDEENVWLVDLSGNRFYYRISRDLFDMDWPVGTTMLVANQPVWLSKPAEELNDLELLGITGDAGYTCTKKIQNDHTIFCPTDCIGWYQRWALLWGCEPAEAGSCTISWRPSAYRLPCKSEIGTAECGFILELLEVAYMWACDVEWPGP